MDLDNNKPPASSEEDKHKENKENAHPAQNEAAQSNESTEGNQVENSDFYSTSQGMSQSQPSAFDEFTEPKNSQAENTLTFYTVSEKKFMIMFIGTFGVYGIYWFYRHWEGYKQSTNSTIWPIARGIFSIFFTHSLFDLFEQKYERKTGERPKTVKHLATLYVVVSILGNIASKLAESGYLLPFSAFSLMLALFITGYCLRQGQSLANYASNDVTGSSNDKLTFANHLWLMLGFVIWVLNIVGINAIISGV